MVRFIRPRGVFLALFLGLLFAAAAQARSGCCSSHQGVCGCACCDGTPLSTICAPYYPNCNGGGGGSSSPPTAPYNLTASLSSPNECLLNWVNNSTTATSFKIEWRIGASVFQPESTISADVSSAQIAGLSPETTYAFRVRASNAAGDSGYTNEAIITTPSQPTPPPCLPSSTNFCLAGGRFKVEAIWQTPDGVTGAAHVVKLTDDSGYLWFFSPSNVEAIVKVLNACALNGRFWFFAGGLTNVKTVITVTDSQNGAVKTYTNPQGTAFAPVQDTSAFSTCP